MTRQRGTGRAAGPQHDTAAYVTCRAVPFPCPLGGYGQSGVGREDGLQALPESTQVKSLWVEAGEPMGDPFVLR